MRLLTMRNKFGFRIFIIKTTNIFCQIKAIFKSFFWFRKAGTLGVITLPGFKISWIRKKYEF